LTSYFDKQVTTHPELKAMQLSMQSSISATKNAAKTIDEAVTTAVSSFPATEVKRPKLTGAAQAKRPPEGGPSVARW
jgi:hypothetical protein